MTCKCLVMLCNDLDEYEKDLGEITLLHRPFIGEEISSATLFDHLPDEVKKWSPTGHAELTVVRIRHVEVDETLYVFCTSGHDH